MPITKRKPPEKPPKKARLSKSLIEKLPLLNRDYLVADTEVPRLKLKVTPAGNISFLLRYRNADGVEKKYKLSNFPDMSVSLARNTAAVLLNNISAGEDPAEERAQRRHGLTLNELYEQFMREHAQYHLRQTTVRNYTQIYGAYIENGIGKKPLLAISRNDVLDVHRSYSETPYVANRVVAFIKRLFNWANENGLHQDRPNPANGVKPYKEHQVERLLSEEQTIRLADALHQVRLERPATEASINTILFLFFTGCRRSEAMRMKWDDVDLERRTVAFIGAKSGDRKQAMSRALLDWLVELKSRSSGAYLFPGAKEGEPIKDIKKTWQLVRTRAGLPDFRLHDIRHNVLSDIAAANDIATAQDVGGHKSIRSTMRYIHARTVRTQAALETSGDRVEKTFLLGKPNNET